MAYVASSLNSAYTNFVASQSAAVNCGSNADRYIVGIATAKNGGAAASRNLSSANYGGAALTLSSVESNTFNSFFQAAHGATALTGSNNFQAVCATNAGGIMVAAAAFDGCAASPLSGLTKSANDTSSPSATVSSATGRTVYALIVEIDTASTLTPGSGVTVVATSDNGLARVHLLSAEGAASVTIGGTFPGTRSWAMWSWSMEFAAAGADLSGNVALSDVAPAGTLADAGASGVSGNVTLDAVAPAGTLGLEPGTVTVPALRNWSGSLQTNVTIPVVTVLSMSTGAQVLALTDQTTHGTTADLTITSTSLAAGTTYMVAGWNADGSQRFAVPLTATA